MQKAKAAQMTNDAIDRAIKRGTGESDGGTYEAITYEGYAPGGVAVLVDVLTDNRNRTGAEVRNVFSKLGGSMAEPGAVGWQFSRRGVIELSGGDEDAVMLAALDAGADDIAADGDGWRVTCDSSHVYEVRDALVTAGLSVTSAESTMVPSVVIEITAADEARSVLRIIDALEDNDDVQDVYSNFDISDDLMEAVDA
jgi:YebC/PmpR family DNA-binding regulatory protein